MGVPILLWTGSRSHLPAYFPCLVDPHVNIYIFNFDVCKNSLLYFVIKINGQPVYPFLNNLLTALTEANVAFLSTAFFAIFCLYLLWATVKGNIKFGLRMLCFTIHPMK
jgi:hypothetical protein